MTSREAQQLRQALEHIRELRQELDLSKQLHEACEQQAARLEKKVTDLMADITGLTRMDGRE